MSDRTEDIVNKANEQGIDISTEYAKAQSSQGIAENPDTKLALSDEEKSGLGPGDELVVEDTPSDKATSEPVLVDDGEINKLIQATKKDWVETRMLSPDLSVAVLDDLYGADGFNKFKSKEEYWANDVIKKQFVNQYGYNAQYKFEEAYDQAKKDYSEFQLGNFTKRASGYSLVYDDLSHLRIKSETQYETAYGQLQTGFGTWSDPTKDHREAFSKIRVREYGKDGSIGYKIIDYSPEVLEKLNSDSAFDGLAYSDSALGMDPLAPTDGFVYEAVYDGKMLDGKGVLVDMRNDQSVSRWDIDTGSVLDGWFKNNKLEADGFLDYAKILVRGPVNMAVNALDTVTQLTRAAVALGYGAIDKVTFDNYNVENSDTYKYLTSVGIRTKKYSTSASAEAMRDGFFGSVETALMTTTDVVLQIALASALGKLGSGAARAVNRSATPAVAARAQQTAAKYFVRGTLTAMATKDAYNEALEHGFTPTEASLITASMGVAMWKASSYASYLFGAREAKQIREATRGAIKNDFGKYFEKYLSKVVTPSAKATVSKSNENLAKTSYKWAHDAVKKVFGTETKYLEFSAWSSAAKQEALEEMAEELGQDLVHHGASAYGSLMYEAKKVGENRYMTIFDDGWLKQAAERYATSAVAGGIGGFTGLGINRAIMGKIDVANITDTSSITEIVAAGKSADLIDALDKLKSTGELGLTTLSTEYDVDLGIFEPMIENSDASSLADMVYNTYLHDIAVIETFLNRGMAGEARARLESDYNLKNSVDNTAMRGDFIKIVADVIDFHSRTGITTKVYEKMDGMTEEQINAYMPEALDVMATDLKNKQKELDEYKKNLNRKIEVDNDEGDDDEVAIKIEEKEPSKEKITDDEHILKKLEVAASESDKIGKKDIETMLINYKKLRAIASGAAAEYYLMQNNEYDNEVLGSIYKRKDEFKNLGNDPLKDMLFNMRFRVIDDKTEQLYKKEIAHELTKEVMALDGLTETQLDRIDEIIKTKGDLLTKEAKEHIKGLYDNMDLSEVSSLFDVNNPNSIFEKDANGVPLPESIDGVYESILRLVQGNEGLMNEGRYAVMPGGLRDRAREAAIYFEKVVADPKNIGVPEMSDSGYGIETNLDYSTSLLELLEKNPGSTASSTILPSISKGKKKFLTVGRKISYEVANDIYFNPNKKIKHDIATILRDEINGSLTKTDLLDVGIEQVQKLIDSNLGDSEKSIFTYSESEHLKNVLSKIEKKEAFAAVLGSYMDLTPGVGKFNLMVGFRKNVLGLINFKYVNKAKPNSEIEEHSFKEYTALSDFFTDFVYDPVKLNEAIRKGELRSAGDEAIIDQFNEAKKSVATTITVDGKDIVVSDFDLTSIEDSLRREFKNLDSLEDIERAIKFLKTPDLKIKTGMTFPDENGEDVIKDVDIHVEGMTKLRLSRFLFKKAIKIMDDSKDGDSPLPYIEAKDEEVKSTFNTLNKLLTDTEDNKDLADYLRDIIESVVVDDGDSPGYMSVITQGVSNIKTTELGALNIRIEKALFDIYNKRDNITFKDSADYDHTFLNEDIDKYIKTLTEGIYALGAVSNSPDMNNIRRASNTLIGAITTDFTPFYSKFKTILSGSAASDIVVLASQETAAKYTSAFISQPSFKNYVHKLYKGINEGIADSSYVKAIFVGGTAGSGKSSATINLGVTIGVSILSDIQAQNIEVLPVANNEAQIEIIKKPIGGLAGNSQAMTPAELESLLKKATSGGNDAESMAAVKAVKRLGVIVMDEATYIDARKAQGTDIAPLLKRISRLIDTFNNTHNVGRQEITLVLLGDQDQSGATKVHKKHLSDVSLVSEHLFGTPYMSYSFRNRNSLLGASITAIREIQTSLSVSGKTDTDSITIPPGTKYGTLDGRRYGIQLKDAKDQDTSNDFMEAMNDSKLVDDIKANIRAVNERNKTNSVDKQESFTVLVSPESIKDFTDKPSLMGDLLKDDEFKDHIKIVPHKSIGGSEANYVIAEIPKYPFGEEVGKHAIYIELLKKKLNTLATRPFDFALLINKSPDIIIPESSASTDEGDGNVLIPNSDIDDLVKQKVRENYLEIMKNIQEGVVIEPIQIDDGDGDTGVRFSMPTDIPTALNKISERLVGDKGSVLHLKNFNNILMSVINSPNQGADIGKLEKVVSAINKMLAADPEEDMNALGNVALVELDTLSESLSAVEIAHIEDLVHKVFILKSAGGEADSIIKKFNELMKPISGIFSFGIDNYLERAPGTGVLNRTLFDTIEDFIYDPNNIEDLEVLFSEILDSENYAGDKFDSFYTQFIQPVFDKILATIPDSDRIEDILEEGALSKDALAVFKAMVVDTMAASAEPVVAIQTKPELLDSNDGAVTNFKTILSTLSSNLVMNVIQDMERLMLDPPADGAGLSMPGGSEVMALLDVYEASSVFKILSEVAYEVYNNKIKSEFEESEQNADDILREIARLKAKLGIPADVKSAYDILSHIADIESSPSLTPEQTKDLAAIRVAWNKLYNFSSKGAYTNHSLWYGTRGSVDRDSNTESLLEYIQRKIEESGGNNVYTIPITDDNRNPKNLKYRTHSAVRGITYEMPSKEEVGTLLGFDKGTSPEITKFGLRGWMSPRGVMNVFIVGYNSKGNKGYLISQFMLTEEAKNFDDYPAEIIDTLRNMLTEATENKVIPGVGAVTVTATGNKYVDLKLTDSIKTFLFSRAGSIIKPDGAPVAGSASMTEGVSVMELSDSGVNVGGHVYVDTIASTATAENSTAGGMYILYSSDNNVNLKSSDIVKANVGGAVVVQGKTIVAHDGSLESELGLLPVKIAPDLVKLGKVAKKYDPALFSEMPTRLSVVFQRYFAEKIGEYTTEDIGKSMEIDIEGTKVSVPITQKLLKLGGDMKNSYDTHVQTRKDPVDYEAAVDNLLSTIQSNSELKTIMDSLAAGFMQDQAVSYKSNTLLYKQEKTGAYVLSLNNLLKTKSDDVLAVLTPLFEAGNFPIKPLIQTGKNVNVGIINDVFINELSDLFRVNITGVDPGILMVSEDGKGAIKAKLNAIEKALAEDPGDGSGGSGKDPEPTFTEEEVELVADIEAIIDEGITESLLTVYKADSAVLISTISDLKTKYSNNTELVAKAVKAIEVLSKADSIDRESLDIFFEDILFFDLDSDSDFENIFAEENTGSDSDVSANRVLNLFIGKHDVLYSSNPEDLGDAAIGLYTALIKAKSDSDEGSGNIIDNITQEIENDRVLYEDSYGKPTINAILDEINKCK